MYVNHDRGFVASSEIGVAFVDHADRFPSPSPLLGSGGLPLGLRNMTVRQQMRGYTIVTTDTVTAKNRLCPLP